MSSRKIKVAGEIVAPHRWIKAAGELASLPRGASGIPEVTTLQKLALALVPAAEQAGAIKASGGVLDGTWIQRGTYNSRPYYVLLGKDDDVFGTSIYYDDA